MNNTRQDINLAKSKIGRGRGGAHSDRPVMLSEFEELFDEQTNTLVLDSVIDITYTQLNTLKVAGTLIEGTTYRITDRFNYQSGASGIVPNPTFWGDDRGIVYVKAISTTELSKSVIRVMAVPNGYGAAINGNTSIGVWDIGKTVTVAGELTIWGAKVWQPVGVLIGTAIDEVTLSAAWTLIPKSSNLSTTYIDMQFTAIYDFTNDWFEKQWDGAGNIIGTDYATTFYDSLPYNYCDITDWNYATTGNLFYNNITRGVFNNSVTTDIYNNKVGDAIFANVTANICNNVVTVTISNNVNTGGIVNNNIIGSINANANSGIIQNNRIIGSINSNTIAVLDIISNTCLNISSNTNVGNIESNSCGTISQNGNTGNIKLNTNLGKIDSNHNDGDIYKNSNTDIIISNNNIGSIQYNTHVINIIENLDASVARLEKNNLYSGVASNFMEIDITGLTTLNLTALLTNYIGIVLLKSTNATESINLFANFTRNIIFNVEVGLVVTFVHNTGANQPRCEGGANAVIDGTTGDWVEFEKDFNGVIKQKNIGTY